MGCKVCATEKQKTFNGEIAIDFPGPASLDKPILFVFAKLVVCLQCGVAEFTVPERELSVLVQGKVVPGAVVSSGAVSKRKRAEKN